MSGVKHTPSWRWERPGCRVYENRFYRGRPIRVADLSVARLDEDELNFRGRLIAAAPDLLEALEKSAEGWANALELKLIPPQHRGAATILRDEARAVIARARGEQSPNHSDQKEVGNG